jgi:hypothetical protein
LGAAIAVPESRKGIWPGTVPGSEGEYPARTSIVITAGTGPVPVASTEAGETFGWTHRPEEPVATTAPIDLHLDVGVVRGGEGVDAALVEDLVPLVLQLSDDVSRVVDLTASGGGDDRRRWIALDCWLAGLGTVSATGAGPNVEQALSVARRDLLRRVAALEVP